MAPEMFGGVADVLHLELTNIGIMVLLGIQYASWILLLIFGHQFPLFTFSFLQYSSSSSFFSLHLELTSIAMMVQPAN